MKNKLRSSLMVLTFCSLVTLTSCNNNKDYEINLDDMENIISLVGFKYAQAEAKITGSGGGVQNAQEQMSPTAYYEVASGDVENFEKYVYFDSKNELVEIWRYGQDPWSDPEEASESEFITPQKRGVGIINHYTMAKKAGSTFTFDKDKLCYVTSFPVFSITEDLEFYFYKNRLVKFIYTERSGEENDIFETQTMELKYEEITPPDPRSKL